MHGQANINLFQSTFPFTGNKVVVDRFYIALFSALEQTQYGLVARVARDSE